MGIVGSVVMFLFDFSNKSEGLFFGLHRCDVADKLGLALDEAVLCPVIDGGIFLHDFSPIVGLYCPPA